MHDATKPDMPMLPSCPDPVSRAEFWQWWSIHSSASDVVIACLPMLACPVQVTEEAEQTSLEICAAEKTIKMLTKVRMGIHLKACSQITLVCLD